MIDADEAESLGFPVEDTAQVIEQPIDTPMTWVPKGSDGGGPASGYKPNTNIRGEFHVEAYEYWWLDPARCDAMSCMFDDERTGEQTPCPKHFILMQVSGELETLDGAIAVQFPMQAVNLRRAEQTDAVEIAAIADLSTARGSLVIAPNAPPPHIGRVDLSLQFADSERSDHGVLSLSIIPDSNADEVVPSRFANYAPIDAQWGAEDL